MVWHRPKEKEKEEEKNSYLEINKNLELRTIGLKFVNFRLHNTEYIMLYAIYITDTQNFIKKPQTQRISSD